MDGRVERLPLSSPVLVGMVVLAVPPERQGLPTSAQGRSAQTGVPRSVIAAAFAAARRGAVLHLRMRMRVDANTDESSARGVTVG